MSTLWAAIIAAGAAILSSALTSYLTHYFERRRLRREYELKWLDERFTPALDFLAEVPAIVGNALHTQEGRDRVVDEIHNFVTGPAKHKNAFCIAVLLDPENTGLQEHILSALTYARIRESEEELMRYHIRLHMSLRVLAEEYRRERQAILAGKSLDALIAERKAEQEESTRRLERALDLVRAFLDGSSDLRTTLRALKKDRISGEDLDWVSRVLLSGTAQGGRIARLSELRREYGEQERHPRAG